MTALPTGSATARRPLSVLATPAFLIALGCPLAAQTPGTVPITEPIETSAGPMAPTGNYFDNTKGNLVRFQVGHIAPLTINPALGGFLFAPNNAGQRVSLIYLPTDLLVAEIPTGPGITAIVQRPQSSEVWAVDSINHCISVIDPNNSRIHRTIPVGGEPHGIAFVSDGSRAFVTCSAANRVDVIDCVNYVKTNSIAIETAIAPRGIAIVGSTAWVTSFYSGNRTVTKKVTGGDASAQEIVESPLPLPDHDLIAIDIFTGKYYHTPSNKFWIFSSI